jgi:hypothetical protein
VKGGFVKEYHQEKNTFALPGESRKKAATRDEITLAQFYRTEVFYFATKNNSMTHISGGTR